MPKNVTYDIKAINQLLKQHGSLRKAAPFVRNEADGTIGTSIASLSGWLSNNGYFVDTTPTIKRKKSDRIQE